MYRERTVRAMYWRARSFDAIKLPLDRKDNRQEWNYRSEIFAFSRRLQENLSEDTLRQIFAHPSYIEKMKDRQAELNMPDLNLPSNQKLVDRGNQLLELSNKPYLRHSFRRVPEDGIEAIHAYLASEPVLMDIATSIGCRDIILSSEWPPSQKTMADTLLAVLAGVEADLGLERARRFAVDIILSYLADKDILDDIWNIPNPREVLNNILRNSQLPSYEARIMFQSGVRTLESCHVVGLYTNQLFLGSSAGETLEIAEDCAAINSLARLFDLTLSRAPMVFGEKSEKIDYEQHNKKHDYIDAWKFDPDQPT